MKIVVQRVSEASVSIDNQIVGKIEKGILILLGIGIGDTSEDVAYLVNKVINLRIFEDENQKMNYSIKDIGGELLIVSQFTLYGDCRKGTRPSYSKAENPDKAKRLYEEFVKCCRELGTRVDTGEFGAQMLVSLVNDGPVTLILESKVPIQK